MKWGRKTPSPPSFGSSVITRVFPASWFSKFKQTGGGGSLETASGKKQQRGKLDFSSLPPAGRRVARFYSLDDDPCWTLSFRKDRGEGGRRSKPGRINPLWYESDDEFLFAVSSFKNSASRELESISELETNKMKPEGNGAFVAKKRSRRPRKLRGRVEWKNKAVFGTGLVEGDKESANPEEEQEFATEPQKTDRVKDESQDSAVSNSRNHHNISFQNFGQSSDGEEDCSQNLENVKFEEIKVKTEFQEESAHTSRRSRSRKRKQNRKKARGSRSECRIQALADMKRARMKSKKKERKEEATESSTIYSSYAVVKSSFNPQQDFRDSMMEMIKERGIRHRKELEELLACYLTLNCDGHHHLIINVFQQVWFELSRAVY